MNISGDWTQLRTEYADRDWKSGSVIEIGLQPHLGEYYKELTEQYPFDFVIGSVHLVNGQDPYYRGIVSKAGRDEEAYREAFQVTLENLKIIAGLR